jgi:DNA-binding transcriptional regulator LsrR (DeoR family)
VFAIIAAADGRTLSVILPASTPLRVGEHVRVVSGAGGTTLSAN